MPGIVNPYLKKKASNKGSPNVPRPPSSGSSSSSKVLTSNSNHNASVASRTVVTPNSIKKQKAPQQAVAPKPATKVQEKKATSVPVKPVVTPKRSPSLLMTNNLKRKNSMKQQLKQEIALLKRRKSLAKHQKETEQRRLLQQKIKEEKMRQIEKERLERQRQNEEKQREREAFLKQKKEDRKKREAERLQKQQERLQKQEEKRRRDEERRKQEQEAYQRYLWDKQQQQQQQQQMHIIQQQNYCTMPSQGALYNRMLHQQNVMHAAYGMNPTVITTNGSRMPLAQAVSAPTSHHQHQVQVPPLMASNAASALSHPYSQISPLQPGIQGMTTGLDGQSAKNRVNSSDPTSATSPASSENPSSEKERSTVERVPQPALDTQTTLCVSSYKVEPESQNSTEGRVPASSNKTSVPEPSSPLAISTQATSSPELTDPASNQTTTLQKESHNAHPQALLGSVAHVASSIQNRPEGSGIVHPSVLSNSISRRVSSAAGRMQGPSFPSTGLAKNSLLPQNGFPTSLPTPNIMQAAMAPLVAANGIGRPLAPGHLVHNAMMSPHMMPQHQPYGYYYQQPRAVTPYGYLPAQQPKPNMSWQRPRPRPRPPTAPAKLCAATESPSPFTNYVLFEVVLVRPCSEKSFGVNLKLHSQSTLVDPAWLEQQQLRSEPNRLTTISKEIAQAPTPAVSEPSTKNDERVKEEDSKVEGKVETLTPSQQILKQEPQEEARESVRAQEHAPTIKKEDEKMDVPEKASENTMETDMNPQGASSADASPSEPTTSSESADSPKPERKVDVTSAAAVAAKEEQKSNQAQTEAISKKAETAAPSLDSAPSTGSSQKEPPSKTVPSTIKNSPLPPSAPVAAPRRRRRRRVNFSVMMVVDAEKQNGFRQKTESVKSELLQPQDIIVKIGGSLVAGMTFSQACGIFSSKAEKLGDDLICAKLVVARKPKPAPRVTKLAVKPTPTKSQASTLSFSRAMPGIVNHTSNFQTSELAILAESILQTTHQTDRLLGQSVSESTTLFDPMTQLVREHALLLLKEYVGISLPLRSTGALQSKWMQVTHSIESGFRQKHQEKWRQAIAQEGGNENLTFGSDAERSALRQLPRPVKGCRCKQNDHEYLHDIKCNLYNDIRRLVPQDILSGLLKSNEKAKKKKKDSEMKTVEKGFKDSIIRLKNSVSLEQGEANFVAKMEEVQVNECKKAVFAPSSLAGMVLSTIFELQREFPVSLIPKNEDEDDSDDEEEEDVPLAALGSKRKASASPTGKSEGKRRRMSSSKVKVISFQYFLRMLQYISKTWGHVYREPSHEEYAWRWELYHGHNSEDGKWGSNCRNPRKPNSLTFETIQSGDIDVKSAADISLLSANVSRFDDAIRREYQNVTTREEKPADATSSNSAAVSQDQSSTNVSSLVTSSLQNMQQHKDAPRIEAKSVFPEPKADKKALPVLNLSQETAEYYCLAAHLLSPSSSGVYDEVLAFLKMEVLEMHSGIPILTADWYSKVDIVILDDMDRNWGSDADPEGRYCINYEMRDSLEERWVKSQYGWSTVDDPRDLVFDFEVLDEWHLAFTGKIEEEKNIADGVGRFGL